MRHATLHQLRIFEAIARRKNFTRAAEELFLTQPTVSAQIKQLTDIVGMPLFEQIGKRIFLTVAGEALYKTGQNIREQLALFEMSIADMQGFKKGVCVFPRPAPPCTSCRAFWGLSAIAIPALMCL